MKKSLGSQPLAFTAPVWVVGTYDNEGKPNIMTASWAGICCSKPPCVMVSLRKATMSYHNIMARKAFTVSIPSAKYAEVVDFCGMVSGKNCDKFKKTGLTPVASSLVDAPFVAEFPVIVECKLLKDVEIGLHSMFIGEVIDVKAEEEVLDVRGIPDIAEVDPFSFDPGTHIYYGGTSLIGEAFSLGGNIDK